MVRGKFLTFTLVVVLLAISLQEALALHCWHCDSKFKDCRDPFNTENLNKEKSQGLYAECPPANSGGTPICLKIISQQYGEEVISRQCSQSIKAAEAACNSSKASVCEKCDIDGCNTSISYGPIAILTMLPVAVIKFLSF